eukprot:Gregarina_sp_Poly_1__3722@NODE_20_length_21312_cov_69_583714_g18_i0_p2_GENE_NODE_20_length_21312_cov_69_583714_g18_i0NODE_20_length_21312_cov_69_583714_g18_i0_p2_ORF_typecomplete_len789_score101_30DUF4754/PF15946_5/0_11DUF4754/PF15946_5/1_6e04DUF4754/PF15946_5/1_8e04_NODE_20_length_21312_cov_69_583714_g18_i03002666
MKLEEFAVYRTRCALEYYEVLEEADYWGFLVDRCDVLRASDTNPWRRTPAKISGLKRRVDRVYSRAAGRRMFAAAVANLNAISVHGERAQISSWRGALLNTCVSRGLSLLCAFLTATDTTARSQAVEKLKDWIVPIHGLRIQESGVLAPGRRLVLCLSEMVSSFMRCLESELKLLGLLTKASGPAASVRMRRDALSRAYRLMVQDVAYAKQDIDAYIKLSSPDKEGAIAFVALLELFNVRYPELHPEDLTIYEQCCQQVTQIGRRMVEVERLWSFYSTRADNALRELSRPAAFSFVPETKVENGSRDNLTTGRRTEGTAIGTDLEGSQTNDCVKGNEYVITKYGRLGETAKHVVFSAFLGLHRIEDVIASEMSSSLALGLYRPASFLEHCLSFIHFCRMLNKSERLWELVVSKNNAFICISEDLANYVHSSSVRDARFIKREYQGVHSRSRSQRLSTKEGICYLECVDEYENLRLSIQRVQELAQRAAESIEYLPQIDSSNSVLDEALAKERCLSFSRLFSLLDDSEQVSTPCVERTVQGWSFSDAAGSVWQDVEDEGMLGMNKSQAERETSLSSAEERPLTEWETASSNRETFVTEQETTLAVQRVRAEQLLTKCVMLDSDIALLPTMSKKQSRDTLHRLLGTIFDLNSLLTFQKVLLAFLKDTSISLCFLSALEWEAKLLCWASTHLRQLLPKVQAVVSPLPIELACPGERKGESRVTLPDFLKDAEDVTQTSGVTFQNRDCVTSEELVTQQLLCISLIPSQGWSRRCCLHLACPLCARQARCSIV